MKILGLNKGEQAHLNKRLTGLIGKVLDKFDADSPNKDSLAFFSFFFENKIICSICPLNVKL